MAMMCVQEIEKNGVLCALLDNRPRVDMHFGRHCKTDQVAIELFEYSNILNLYLFEF